MKRPNKKRIWTPEEEARRAESLRRLEERIAYHKAKLAEEQAQREG